MDTAPLNAVSPTSMPQREGAQTDGACLVFPGFETLGRPEALTQLAGLAAKRVIDLTAAALGLFMLAPVLIALALAIRLDSPGPTLFRQLRLGRYGRPFWIYKFRTMRPDAEAELNALESKNESARGILFKMRDDPRVTRLGRFLRRTNFDELPQLFNIFKGEMSLVGPRPFQERDCERLLDLDPAAFTRRLDFPPGLTGAWQVGRISPVDSDHLLDLDLDYVENWSLARDLQILYRTFFIVLKGFLAP
jgi:lipopolysaccharide/colanic/teichoic acid biosynthesis glycosyltransferase